MVNILSLSMHLILICILYHVKAHIFFLAQNMVSYVYLTDLIVVLWGRHWHEKSCRLIVLQHLLCEPPRPSLWRLRTGLLTHVEHSVSCIPHCLFRRLRMTDYPYSLNSAPLAYATVTAFRLMRVDSVHWVRVPSSGTFAAACNHAVSGMDFFIIRIR